MDPAFATPPSPPCELCRSPANILCPSDDACLCWRCDSVVHGANFLVARHRRAFLCGSCASPTAFVRAGARLCPESRLCPRCSAGTMESYCSGGSGIYDGECSVLTECESEALAMLDHDEREAARSLGGRNGKRSLRMSGFPPCKRVQEGPHGVYRDDVSDAVSGIDDEVSSADGESASSPVRPAVGDVMWLYPLVGMDGAAGNSRKREEK